jgi:hypothetical protein
VVLDTARVCVFDIIEYDMTVLREPEDVLFILKLGLWVVIPVRKHRDVAYLAEGSAEIVRMPLGSRLAHRDIFANAMSWISPATLSIGLLLVS